MPYDFGPDLMGRADYQPRGARAAEPLVAVLASQRGSLASPHCQDTCARVAAVPAVTRSTPVRAVTWPRSTRGQLALVGLWMAAVAVDGLSTARALATGRFTEANTLPAAAMTALGAAGPPLVLGAGSLLCALLCCFGLRTVRSPVLVLLQRGLIALALVKLGFGVQNLLLLAQM